MWRYVVHVVITHAHMLNNALYHNIGKDRHSAANYSLISSIKLYGASDRECAVLMHNGVVLY